MLTARGNPSAAAIGNRIYALGGFDTPDTGTDLAEVFDRSANRWEPIARLPVATTGPGATGFGGQVFVVGGGITDGPVNSVHVYNPQTDSWSSDAAPMPTRRELLKVTELGGRLYAIGGSDGTGLVATVERYTPATDTWETVAPMNSPRGNPGVVSAAGRIFVVGSGDTPVNTSSEAFDPNTNTWQQLDAVLPVGRGSLSAERGPGNVILAIGGFEGELIASARVEALKISQL
jgi:N-acetylneuraminic acid mutarotase